ncbi:NAD-dependent epimerase/dehydratase family protein [Sinorhizobium kostiense]|uniref:NAD-dependent epimerase/dehydratase family protein n=1 Tax=Sinorhizobium kostiense TaxID=76747 RepID=UPI002E1F3FB2|nr:NAD-dependent epimerase/dehydratase family protein [Sinorhizobium kostiense]
MSYLRRFRARYSQTAADCRKVSLRNDRERKRVLVTGGAGFLGSHLCRLLLEAGHQVVCLDDFSIGAKSNVEPLMRFDAFAVAMHDVVEPFELEIDEIYHLANPASPPHCQADPIRAMQTHVLGTINVLELAARHGARVLHVTFSDDGAQQLYPESVGGDAAFLGRRSCYEEGPRSAEALFSDFHELYQLDVRLVRIFNAYGPMMRADDNRIISNFVLRALKGEDITIYGDPSETSTFCFAYDLIDGIVRVMASPASLPVPIDLGSPMEFAIGEVAEQVIELVGSRSSLVLRPKKAGILRRRQPDIALAMQEFGWCPRMDLSGGLLQTIGYFDRLLSASRSPFAEAA